MTFTQMLRALRNQEAEIVGIGWTIPVEASEESQSFPCWKVLEFSTRFFYYVPLPEGWVLPT